MLVESQTQEALRDKSKLTLARRKMARISAAWPAWDRYRHDAS
jgi:hypothetical protein